ncbi:UNVERIFIED_CONTAM: hypothetical protein B566_EDAN018864, partial [Ephemera danica]
MPVNDNALLEAVSTVARNRSVTVNLQKSAKAGMIAGGSCFVGAVLGGPVGLAVVRVRGLAAKMPVNDNALLEAVSTVARNRSVTVNLQKSAKAGMIAGGSCFVGAVLGGPVGLAV